MVINQDFWKNKRVFITGHTGFKGSWLTVWLKTLGAKCCGYSLDIPTRPSLFHLANVEKNIKSILGDLRDFKTLKQALKNFRPEIIFHLAAQSLVRLSYRKPVDTYSVNFMGTVHLLEAIRQTRSARVVINVTTDKCYENKEEKVSFRESDPLGGYDPYSSSKACSEIVTAAYRNSFFNPLRYAEHKTSLASARAGNVIGGGDWAFDRLVPDVMRAILHKKPVAIRSPSAVRPWQHVLDPLRGYLILAEKMYRNGPSFAEAWNFGPSKQNHKPVSWIVDHLVKLWGSGRWIRQKGAHPHEAGFLMLDCAKARQRLAWRPMLSLDAALKMTVEWYRAYQQKQDMNLFTANQIHKFMAGIRHRGGKG